MSLAKRWEKWKGEPSHWHNLDGYFKPIVTRFFITWFATAPLIASITEKYRDVFILPFDWWILWLASLSYALAFAIHSWKCPQFIKRYPTYLAYKERGHSPRWLVWEFHGCWTEIDENEREKLENRVIKKEYATKADDDLTLREGPQISTEGTSFQFMNDNLNYNLVIKEDAPEDFVRDFFWEIFGRWTSNNIKFRMITWLLLGASLILVLITVFQDIFYVASLLLCGR